MVPGGKHEDAHSESRLSVKDASPPPYTGAALSDEDYRRLFEKQDEGAVICELLYDDAGKAHDYRYLAVNPAFERRAGLAPGQAIGKTRRELFPAVPTQIEGYAQAVNTGQSVQYEHYSAVTGKYTSVHITSLGGRCFAVLSCDIHERIQAIATLSTGAMRYHNLAELMPGMLWAADPQGHSFDRNSRWQEYTGQTAEQANGQGWLDIIHPDDMLRVCERWALSVRTGRPYLENTRLRRASDGSYRWHTVQALLRQDDEGSPIGWFGTCVDIDDLKQAKEALQKSELQLQQTRERFETTLSHSAIALFMYDLDLRCTWSHSPNLGLNTDRSLGKRNLEFFERAEDAMAFDAMMQAVIDSGVSRRQDILIHAGGVDHYFDVLIEPLRNAEGHMVGLDGTSVDITERKQLEFSLLEADRQKNEFLATLGHELRNPLGAISNATEILQRTGKDPTRLEWCCEVLARQCGQMTRLVDDLLDISRISQGKIELNRQPVQVADLARHALEASRPMLQARRHEISLQLPSDPVWVKGDAARLIQVLCNLLNNAAKYTDEGGHVRLEVESSGGEVTLRVSDNGRGVPAEALSHLFDLFYQVGRTLDRSEGGLGIGLSLAKRLVEQHGGSVRAYSAGVGKGSDFVIRLPRLPHVPSTEAGH